MLKLSGFNYETRQRKKGQWFIVSAIIASAALLALSFVFRGYFVTDTSLVQLNDESFYFENIKASIEEVKSVSDCDNIEKSLEELDHFTTESLIKRGILFKHIYDTECPIFETVNTRLLLIQSDNMEVWDGERPVISAVRAGNPGKVVLENSLSYDFYGTAEVSDSFGTTFDVRDFIILRGLTEGDIPNVVDAGDFVTVRNFTILGKNQFTATP
jgi:hypothetical protein